MVWILRLEKVIFYLLYVLPYFLIGFFLIISSDNITSSYFFSLSINDISSEINSMQDKSENIFSTLYDIFIFLLYGIGLLGIHSYLYNKDFFSKKFWIFIMLILIVDDIGEIIYNLDEVLIAMGLFVYSIYYYFTLYLLVRSYYE